MPKAILEFNLPEEQTEFETAVAAGKLVSIIANLDEKLRSKIKYEETSDAERTFVEQWRNTLQALIDDEGLTDLLWR